MRKVRGERRNEEIKKIVSKVIFDMKDPRISPMTTITNVEVSSDLKHAKAFVSVYDADDEARRATVTALNHAAGFISHQAGQQLLMHSVPAFKFFLDDSINHSIRITELLNQISTGHDGEE